MKMMGSTSRYVDAPADTVFGVVTDLANLPSWNDRMTAVVELPQELTAEAQWVVGFCIMGKKFNSRSVVIEIDRERRRFVHRSKPDDDNPSSTVWTWDVTPEGRGSRVSLQWHLQPVTLGRRLFAAPLRAFQIPRQDAPASLEALSRVCAPYSVTSRHQPDSSS